MRKALLLAAVTALIAAGCGGGKDEPTATTVASAPAVEPAIGADEPIDSASQEKTSSDSSDASDDSDTSDDVSTGEGATTEFCGFIAGIDEAQDNIGAGLDPAAFQTAMENSLTGLRRARDLAPSEVEGDVQLILDAFLSLFELFEEYDWNLITIGTNAADDPRLLAFDEAAFSAAVSRVGDFCGIDLDAGDDVEETFTDITGVPEALIPPGVTQTNDIGGGSYLLTTTLVFAEAVTFYTDAMGPPVFADEGQKVALWTAEVDGRTVTVSLGEVGNKVEVVLAIAG